MIFPVSTAKLSELEVLMKKLGVSEMDWEESFVRSQGAGGQNVNKVSSCVILKHKPTGLWVKCQEERSQALNRFLARRLLLKKIESRELGQKSAERMRIEKLRRQKRRRSRRAKVKMLESKRHRAAKKQLRKAPSYHGSD